MTQTSNAKVLVVGATGTVGSEATRALLAKGAHVRALVRSEASARKLDQRVEVVRGDLRDAAAVASALDGVSAAFYVSPHEADEEQLAEQFVRACEARGVRIVFVGVHVDGATRLSRALQRFVFGRFLPHYRPKFRLAERVRRSKADPVILMPSNFFQNDELFREELLAGEFLQRFDRPVNRVDVRDVGEAAARACLDKTLPSGAYPVSGPESLDGEACTKVWAAVLGRPVRYAADDEARFDAAIERSLSGRKREDFLKSFRVLRKFEVKTDPRQVARTTALLGRPPTNYATYVRDMVDAWRQMPQRRHAA